MAFEPDYHYIIDVASNKKPERLPLYEHQIDASFIEKIMDEPLDMETRDFSELSNSYEKICKFWKMMTYDTISFEVLVCPILPDHGALYGGKPGSIQNRDDFQKFPFDEIPEIFWNFWTPHIEAIKKAIPSGMKLVGGVGNGVFEISEDLVGYEYLCLLMYDDPDLFADLYVKIGDLMSTLWTQLLERYGDLFAVCRMGDDLGYKLSTMLAPDTIIKHIIPQYRRIIDLIHGAGKRFLFHSCGNIFSVMEDVIEAGIDAKHSNEDIIAPFSKWIDLYSDRIGFFGGIDLNLLCLEEPQTVFQEIVRLGQEFRNKARGYAVGSGNSIPDYIPVENYLAMIEAVKEIRRIELKG